MRGAGETGDSEYIARLHLSLSACPGQLNMVIGQPVCQLA
jgi:hypothetical protein